MVGLVNRPCSKVIASCSLFLSVRFGSMRVTALNCARKHWPENGLWC